MRQEHAELLVQLDARHPGSDGDPDEEFSVRELDVLAMLPTPLNMREIAEELFVIGVITFGKTSPELPRVYTGKRVLGSRSISQCLVVVMKPPQREGRSTP